MTRIFAICLALFPLIFAGMLIATGTMQDVVVPLVKSMVSARFGGDEEEAEIRPDLGVVDSLLVANLETREVRVQTAMDSLSVLKSRIETEQQELARLGAEVQKVLDDLGSLRSEIAEREETERRALAGIFGEMDTDQAARILGLLSGDDVEYLVKSMKRRKAAEVLAALDPRLAARLSQRILAARSAEVGKGTP